MSGWNLSLENCAMILRATKLFFVNERWTSKASSRSFSSMKDELWTLEHQTWRHIFATFTSHTYIDCQACPWEWDLPQKSHGMVTWDSGLQICPTFIVNNFTSYGRTFLKLNTIIGVHAHNLVSIRCRGSVPCLSDARSLEIKALGPLLGDN